MILYKKGGDSTKKDQDPERANIDREWYKAQVKAKDLVVNQTIKGNPEVVNIMDNYRKSKQAVDSLNTVRKYEYFQQYFTR